jgi:hypothetical protein
LHFIHPGWGRRQCSTAFGMPLSLIGWESCHRSYVVSLAHSTALLNGIPGSPCLLLFRAIHKDYIPQRKIAVVFSEQQFGSIKSCAQVWGCRCGSFAPVNVRVCFQKHLATVQSIRTCLIDSSSAPQTSQFGTGSMCLLWTPFAGRNALITRHQNTRTFGGTQRRHMRFHEMSPEPEALPCFCLLPLFVVDDPACRSDRVAAMSLWLPPPSVWSVPRIGVLKIACASISARDLVPS